MPTPDEMMADLATADAAGDTELAQHIAAQIRTATAPKMGAAKAAGLGALQGGTAFLADEAQAAGQSAQSGARSLNQPLRMTPGPKALAKLYPGLPYTDAAAKWFDENRPDVAAASEAEAQRQGQEGRYLLARGEARKPYQQAQEQRPGAYLAGNIGGAVLTAPVNMGLKAAGGLGALQGFGASEAGPDDGLGLASDIGIGGIGGVAGQAIGKGLAAAGSKIRGYAGKLVGKAQQRATQQAADEASSAVRSLEGTARERAANAYRQMERVNLALADKTLPAADRSALEAFKQSPEWADLLAANAKGALEAAPDAAAERAAAQSIAGQARADLPAAIQTRASELMKPAVKADARSFAKGWLEPLAWAYGGKTAGEAMGLDPQDQMMLAGAAGLIGGRTRAGKALLARLRRPGNQAAIGDILGKTATSATGGTSQALARALAAAMAARAVQNQEGD